MMLLEMIAMAILFVYGFLESKAMGLHAEIPPDGPGRAAMFKSRLVEALKSHLQRVVVVEAHPNRLVFRTDAQAVERILRLECGRLHLDDQELAHVGADGLVEFRMVNQHLIIDVVSHAEPDHPLQFRVRLPLHDTPAPAPPEIRGYRG